MKNIYRASIAIVFITLFSQCKVFDNEVIVPGYVYIPSYKLETAIDGSQGDTTSKIVDAWVYDNGSTIGSYGLPALIPIQKKGSMEIGVDAGILKSGQDYERMPNPLLTRAYFTIDAQPEKIDTIIPV